MCVRVIYFFVSLIATKYTEEQTKWILHTFESSLNSEEKNSVSSKVWTLPDNWFGVEVSSGP